MKMRRERIWAHHERHDAGGAIHRLERADPKPHRPTQAGVEVVERAQQIEERYRLRQVAPVRSEVNAGNRDLFEARGRDTIELRDDVWNRYAPRFAAGRGDDAVGARLRAACLYAQGERRSAGHARRERVAAG